MFRLPLEAILKRLGVASAGQAEEIAGELAPMLAEASEEGVVVRPQTPGKDECVTITYSGLLHRSGATSLYLHHGFGPGAWRDVTDTPMQAVDGGWSVEVVAKQRGELAFCFHDGANHWDNHYEQDWHLPIK